MRWVRFSLRIAPVYAMVLLAQARGAENKLFELHGSALQKDRTPFIGTHPTVSLSAPYGPLSFNTIADARGRFRIKKVPAGMYVVTAYIPRVARARRTVEITPSFADAKGRIEVSLQMESRPRSQGMYLVSAIQLSVPESARAEYEKGRLKLTINDRTRAANHFRKAVDIAPQFSAAWYQLGWLALQEKHFQDAVTHFREALKYLPDNYRALLNLGGALLMLDDAAEAAAVTERAVRARPDDAEARVQLGQSLMMIGRLDEAEEQLKKAVSLDPANYYFPQILLAEIYHRRSDYASMAGQLEEFLRLHPDYAKAREVARLLSEIRAQMRKGLASTP